MTTALYRRYRPETFADVIGQEHVTEPLMQALRTGRVNHAYLFSGPRGCGKTTSARILARCLNCEEGPTPTPCGTCPSCIALARGGSGSVDVIEIDAASHGGVDDARDLRERASYGPAQSRYKVYIIDEAHMVTTQGFNALLKIVEEPPEHVKFVFATTEPDKVIGTIRSRTHHYPFRLVPPARLQGYLAQLCESEHVAVEPGVLSFVVRAGGGSVRDSLSILDQLISGSGEQGLTYDGAAALLGFTNGELLDATIDGLAARDAAAVFHQVDRIIESGHDPRRFVEDLLERLRDLIIVAAVPDGASSVLRGIPDDQLERMRQQAGSFSPATLSRSADIVNAGLTEMTGATAPRLQLELICARLLLPGAAGESGYAARLDRLERRLDVGSVERPRPPRGSAEPSPATASSPEPAPVARDAMASKVEAIPPRTPTSQTPAAQTSTPQTPGPETPAAQSSTPQTPAGPVPGEVDTEAIRRSWPDVLDKIFTIKRVTWTLLSQHAQVLDYDGQRLLLGIATNGLADTFRRGPHAEIVRQALIEVLGVDTTVEGQPSSPAETAAPVEAAATAAPAATAATAAPVETAAPAAAPSGVDHRRDWGSVAASTPPPSWASPDVDSASGADDPRPAGSGTGTARADDPSRSTAEAPQSPMQRARRKVAAEASKRHTGSAASVDDAQVSVDDENIEEASGLGQPVIESVLGGTVIAQLDQ